MKGMGTIRVIVVLMVLGVLAAVPSFAGPRLLSEAEMREVSGGNVSMQCGDWTNCYNRFVCDYHVDEEHGFRACLDLLPYDVGHCVPYPIWPPLGDCVEGVTKGAIRHRGEGVFDEQQQKWTCPTGCPDYLDEPNCNGDYCSGEIQT